MLAWLEIFSLLVVVDVLYAVYTKQVQVNNPVISSLTAAAIYIINAYIVIEFVHDPMLLIPAGLGAFVGTYIGVKFNSILRT
jgi:uncharacterized membrane protein YfcA